MKNSNSRRKAGPDRGGRDAPGAGLLQAMLSSLDDVIVFKDSQFVYRYVSPKFSNFFGRSESDILGKTDFDLYPEDEAERCRASDEAVLATGKANIRDEAYRTPDGRHGWINTVKTPVNGPDGLPRGILVALRDVTARKRVETLLFQNERRYRSLFESLPVGVCETDLDGRIIICNQAHNDIFGYLPGELEDRSWLSLGWSDRERSWLEGLRKRILKSHPSPVPFKVRCRTSQGEEIQVRFYWDYRLGEDDELTGFVILVTDITEQERARRELQKSEQRYSSIFRYAPVGIYRSTPDGRFLVVNPYMAEMHGYTSPEDMVADVADIGTQLYANPEDRRAMLGQLFEHGEVASFETPMLRRDGSVIWTVRNTRLMRDSQGRVRHIKGFVMDITRQKKLEQLREEMMHIARHDLKTPIVGTVAGVRMLKTYDNLESDQIRVLDEMERIGLRMLDNLDTSLTLYRLEAGDHDLELAPVDMAEMVGEAFSELGNHADIMGVGLDLEEGDPCVVMGESGLLRSLVDNLLKNAIDAAPRDSRVKVCLNCGGAFAELTFHNMGEVPAGMRNRFFEKFATAGKSGGTGIGTYAARLVTEAHGGEIGMKTSPKTGTVITVRLPPAPK